MKKLSRKYERVKVAEGDWFIVPVDGGGYCVGVVARHDSDHGALGYFFGPRHPKPPAPRVEDYRPKDAVLIARFSDLGISSGEWPVVGHSDVDHRAWPVPAFGRIHALIDGLGFRKIYSDRLEDTSDAEVCELNDVRHLPYDSMHGAEALTAALRQVFEGTYDPYRMPPH